MGHAFNLAHSWQKAVGAPWGSTWIPLTNDPEARSFMNYPYNVQNGQGAFFSDFEFRFTDQELLFMRHAPERFVQMGNADWFDHHGLEQAALSVAPSLRLQVRANREQPTFDFLEPVSLELKLTNIMERPQLLDGRVLTPQNLTVIIKPYGKPARRWAPFSWLCQEPQPTLLTTGESTYAPLRLFAGTNGWDIAEPGDYDVHVVLHLESEDIVSAPISLRVAAPRSWEEERLGADLFREDTGRALIFGGTQVMRRANDILRDVVDKLPESRVAIHARVAIGNPLAIPFKSLAIPEGAGPMASAEAVGGTVSVRRPDPDEADAQLSEALLDRAATAAETLGHVTYKRQVDRMSGFRAARGDPAAAADSQRTLRDTLEQRQVLPKVLAEVSERERGYASLDKKRDSGSRGSGAKAPRKGGSGSSRT
jgi:hypothetical protein